MSWDVFLSHASEDKADVALPLKQRLEAKGVRVWYDESTLQIGDRLRQSIDNGLTKSRYGVVVLSPTFFKKKWSQRELSGLLSVENSERPRILPVWHQVTAERVREFSPILAGLHGISTHIGLEHVVNKIVSTVMVYRVKDHLGHTHEIDLTRCQAHGEPIVPAWLPHDPARMGSQWLVDRLSNKTELRIHFNRELSGGTWLVVDVWNEEGEVINLDQLREIRRPNATTTTTTTPPPLFPK